jgi:hypothetical protein
MCLLQVFALEGTRKRILALCSTADSADFSLYGGTMALGSSFTADLTQNGFGHSVFVSPLSLDQMQRVDLYIRVEVELDEDDQIEKVASEICRQIKKNNVVRNAEFSNAVTRD